MANATITSNYAGQAALPYVAPAILAADTIANNYVSVLDNVRYKANLRKFDGAAIAAATCEFTTPSSGQMTLSDVVLTTTALQVNEQVCNKDLRTAWEAEQMRGQSSNSPADFQSYAAQYVAARVAESVEYNLWQGNYDSDGSSAGSASHTLFNGICKLIVDASPTYETLLGAAIDSTTVIGNLTSLVNTSPDALKGDPEAKIYMSRKTAHLYYQALAGTYQIQFLNDGLVSRFMGYNIVTPAGMPDDTLVLSRPENLYFGTDLLTDHIEAAVLNLMGVTGDDVTRVIMKFSGGTAIVDHDSYSVVRRDS